MFILGIDTSRLPIRLGVRKGADFVFECTYHDLKFEELPDICEKIVDLLGIAKADLIAIGAITGPGNYTGLRSGLTMVKTMAQVLNLPLYGFNSLDVLLYGARHLKGKISPLVNVRQRQVYTGIGSYNEKSEYEVNPHSIALTEWMETLKTNHPEVICCGDSFDWPEGINASFIPIDTSADLVAQLTWEAYQANPISDFYAVQPFYIRPAVVAPPVKSKEKKS